MTSNERWKPIVGYETLFLISDHGNVFSLRSNKVLKTRKSKDGYVLLSTRIGGRDGKTVCFRIHREVAKAFVKNNNPSLIEVNHIDCNKQNNVYTNLEWVTPKQNMKHAKLNGRMDNNIVKKAQASRRARQLSNEDVKYIRQHYIKGDTTFGSRGLGRMYGVSKNRITEIVNHASYKDVN